MRYGFVILALGAQGLLVTGQILLKQAMSQAATRRRLAARFACAIGCMTVYFFLWLAIARSTPLSQLAPFDALGPVLLVAAVHVVLRERLSRRGWVAVGLILLGLGAIALS